MSQILQNVDLAPLTNFKVGGWAENYLRLDSASKLKEVIKDRPSLKPCWFLGSGTNVLISDQGLNGLTLHFQGGQIIYQDKKDLIIADSGVSWDELVLFTLKHQLWGIELMSGIPGTVGGAVAININAYGQSLVESLKWVEIYDLDENKFKKVITNQRVWGYKKSPFMQKNIVIIRAAFQLAKSSTVELSYETALNYARTHSLDHKDLLARRQIILGTRSLVGSLLNDTPIGRAKTCGSFFKNPLVKVSQIKKLIAHDETNLSEEALLKMNLLHGGTKSRVSAAHVLLAAGFKRGQTFNKVRLHPDHVLKIENYQKASAQEIYDTARLIQATVKMKLEIDLEFEVSLLGKFKNN